MDMAKAAAAWVYDFLKVFTWDMSFRKNRIIQASDKAPDKK